MLTRENRMKFSFTKVLAVATVAFIPGLVKALLPPSDECSTATNIPISELPYSTSVSISNYTTNATDLTPCDVSGRTMWWKFTAPTDGVLSVLTNDSRLRFGPGLDLNIGAISGSCGNSTRIQCGVNFFSGSSVAHPIVHAGVTYFIEVGETLNSTGDAQFNLTVKFDSVNLTISGDKCNDAIVIPHTALPFNQNVDTRLYTNNAVDLEPISTCGYGPEQNTIFYRYTPIMSGLLIIDTSGSVSDAESGQLESTVTVFTGRCGSTAEVFCDEQDITETSHYPVSAGVTYTIRLGGYDIGGYLNFTLSFQRDYFNVNNEKKKKSIGVLYDLYNGIYPDGLFPTNTINYATFSTSNLSIEAIFSKPNKVLSVRLQLDNQQSICKNKSDGYKVVGELGNVTIPFTIGKHAITATAFSNISCSGNEIGGLSQPFLVKGCDFIQYGLYDAQRTIYNSNLYNGSIVSSPPCHVNIGVTFICGFVQRKVRLELRRASNNALVSERDELTKPYFLFGRNGSGSFASGTLQPGEYKLTAFIDNIAHPSVSFTMGTCAVSPKVDTTFGIDLRFSDGIFFDQSKLFPKIVKRISSLIVGDRPDFKNTKTLRPDYFCGDFPSRIDDLHICATIRNYDDGVGGILGFLFNTYSRPTDNLPITGTIIFDSEDFSNMVKTGKAENYILQQLIRTLGLGESWKQFGFVNSGTPPCSYSGTKAKAEFKVITGCSSDIPLEQNSIPEIDGYGDITFDCKFWDPVCLKDEVLTLTVGANKISRITMGALADLGYVVNYTAADHYGSSDVGTCSGCHGRRHLKGKVLSASKQSTSTCYSGMVHQRAIHHGRKMLREVHDHHIAYTKHSPTPEDIVFTGNHHVTVMYQHEDGTLCSVVVPADSLI